MDGYEWHDTLVVQHIGPSQGSVLVTAQFGPGDAVTGMLYWNERGLCFIPETATQEWATGVRTLTWAPGMSIELDTSQPPYAVVSFAGADLSMEATQAQAMTDDAARAGALITTPGAQETAVQAAVPGEPAPPTGQPLPGPDAAEEGGGPSKVIVVGLIVIIVLIVFAAIWFLLIPLLSGSDDTPAPVPTPTVTAPTAVAPTTSVPTEIPTVPPTSAIPTAPPTGTAIPAPTGAPTAVP